MIFKLGFTVLYPNIMSDSVVVRTNMLQIAFSSADLTFYLQSVHLSFGLTCPLGQSQDIRTIKELFLEQNMGICLISGMKQEIYLKTSFMPSPEAEDTPYGESMMLTSVRCAYDSLVLSEDFKYGGSVQAT